MAFNQGIDFRSTAGFVTDPANTDVETATTANYPRTSAQGNTVGWEDAISGVRNRTSTVDARLAGIAFAANGTAKRYRIDVPSSGWYKITLALGDNTTGQSQSVQVFDNTTLLSNVVGTGLASAAGHFYDACGVLRTSAADWVSNEVSFIVFLSSTIFRVKIATSGASGNSTIAHVRVEDASAPTLSSTGIDFRSTGNFVADSGDASPQIDSITGGDYPHINAQNWTVGWETNPNSTNDRSSGVDARLAGENAVSNTGTAKFRIDLPATGDYRIALAVGDNTVGQTQTVSLIDGSTTLTNLLTGAATAAGQFYDAAGNLRTSAADWVTNETQIVSTFASTIFRVQLGANGATSGSSTIAHIHIAVGSPGSKTQTAKLRVQKTLTKLQTAKARIQTTSTKAQTARVRIQNTAVTKAQTAKVRVSKSLTKTQSSVARISKSLTKTQSAVARISNATVTKTQTAKLRVQATVTKTQTAKVRVQATVTKTQSSVAHIASSSFTGTKTQTAKLRVQATVTKTQTATARIATGSVTLTVTAVLQLAADDPTLLTVQGELTGQLSLASDGPSSYISIAQPAAATLIILGDAPTLPAAGSTLASARILLAADPPTNGIAGVIFPNSGIVILASGEVQAGGPSQPTSGVLKLVGGTAIVVYPETFKSAQIILKSDPAYIPFVSLGTSAVILLQADAATLGFAQTPNSGILILKADNPTVTPLTPPTNPPGGSGNISIRATL